MKIQLSHLTDPTESIENAVTAFFAPSYSGHALGQLPTLGYAAIAPDTARLVLSLRAIEAAAGREKASPLDLWLDGTFGLLARGGASGSYTSGHLGMSYRFTPTLLAGTVLSLDQAWARDGASTSSSLGVTMTPYVGGQLSESLFYDAYAGYGLTRLSVSPDGIVTDTMPGQRWLVGGSFSGQFRVDNWLFAPVLNAHYGELATPAYVDGHGTTIAAERRGEGALAFAPRLSVDFVLEDDTVVTPSASLTAAFGLTNDNGTWTATGLSDAAALGLSIRTPGGALFDARLGATGLVEGDLRSVSARVGVQARLR